MNIPFVDLKAQSAHTKSIDESCHNPQITFRLTTTKITPVG